MRAALLMLLLTGCATAQPVTVCPSTTHPNAVAVVCTQQPTCRRNCYVTVTAAQATGSGDQSVTSSDAPSVSETKSRSFGPLP